MIIVRHAVQAGVGRLDRGELGPVLLVHETTLGATGTGRVHGGIKRVGAVRGIGIIVDGGLRAWLLRLSYGRNRFAIILLWVLM